jgi:hypothetical protein
LRAAPDPVLQLAHDPLGQFGADAVGARDHRLVLRRDRARQVGRVERRQDRQRDARADPLHPGQQPEPVALGRMGKADQAQEILADQHLGMQHRRLANRAERRQRARRTADQIADAADVDHRMVDTGPVEPALEMRDHAPTPVRRAMARALAR